MKRKIVVTVGVILGCLSLFGGGCKNKKEDKGKNSAFHTEYAGDKEPENTEIPMNTEIPENTPTITGNTDKKVKFSFLEEKDERKAGEVVVFESGIFYPVFTEGKGTDALNVFVNRILEEYREFLEDAAVSAQEEYEAWEASYFEDVYLPEAEELKISVLWQDEEVVTLHLQYYSNTGGAHPNVFEFTYVVEKKTGSQVEIGTLSKKYGITTEQLVQYASEVFYEKGGDGLYVTREELEKTVLHFLENNQWYLTEEGICIFANPYDIAPYAYGMITCEISYSGIEQGLKK